MAVYTDAFTNTNGTELSAHNVKWVQIRGGTDKLEIQSNQLAVKTGATSELVYYYNDTFATKHYSKLTVTVAASGSIGVIIRGAAGDNCYYCFYVNGDKLYNGQIIAGTPTDWDSGLTLPAQGTVIELAVDASVEGTIYYKENGATDTTYTSKTALSGGRAGVCGITGHDIRGDNWEGGDVGVSAFSVSASDTATLTEARTITATRKIAISQTVTLAEARTVTVTPHAARSIDVDDSVTLTEARTVEVGLVGETSVNVGETVTLTEARTVSVTPHAARNIDVDDSITLSEARAVFVQGPPLEISANETVTLTEAAAALLGIGFDAFSSAVPGTGNLSWTHTPANIPRGAIVYVIQNASAVDRVSGVTYGGVTMNEVTGSPLGRATGETGAVYCYYLGASLPAGAQTVVVTVTDVGVKVAGCITITAGMDTSVQDTDVTISSTSLANPSATLNLGGQMGFCAIGFHSGQNNPTGITPLANWNARYEYDYTSQTAGIYTYDVVGTADVTAGWTQLADDALAICLAVRMGAFFNVNVSQGITVSESRSVAIPAALQVSVTQAVTLTEYASARFPRVVAVSETVTLTEAAAAAQPFAHPAIGTDSVTVSEARTVALVSGLPVNVSDTVTVVELPFYGWGEEGISVADTVTVAEARTVAVTPHPNRAVTVSETVTLSEARAVFVAEAGEVAISAGDGILVTQSAAVAVIPHAARTVDVDETVTLSEAGAVVLPDALGVAGADTVTVGEAGEARLPLALTASGADNITTSEEATASVTAHAERNAAGSDNVTVGEAAAAAITPHTDRAVAVSETIFLDDDETVEFGVKVIPGSDAVTVTEARSVAVTPHVDRAVSVSDTVTLGEADTVNVIPFGVSTVTAGDNVTVGEARAVSVTPHIDRTVAGSDAVTLAEAAAAAVIPHADLDIPAGDTITTGEAATAALPAALVVAVSDSITAGESATPAVIPFGTMTVSASQAVSLGEAVAAAVTPHPALNVSASDSITLADAATLTRQAPTFLPIDVDDSVTITEAPGGAVSTSLVAVSEAVAVGEAKLVFLPGYAFDIRASETVTVLSPSAVFMFALIGLTLEARSRGTTMRARSAGTTLTGRDADLHERER